jgi:hypothetical protein
MYACTLFIISVAAACAEASGGRVKGENILVVIKIDCKNTKKFAHVQKLL